MQIHELNDFTGEMDANAYVAVDNGNDTGRASINKVVAGVRNDLNTLETQLNARIDNIIAGGTAPSAAEVTDARTGSSGVVYPSLGDSIRYQNVNLKNGLAALTGTDILLSTLYLDTGTAATTWKSNFIAKEDVDCSVVVNSASGIDASAQHYAYVYVVYSDNTATPTYIDELGKFYKVNYVPNKTISMVSIALVRASSALGAAVTSTWDVLVVKGTPRDEETQSQLKMITSKTDALAKLLIGDIYADHSNGQFYGFESVEYVAQSTTENWQSKSYTKAITINIGPNTLVSLGCLARHGLGEWYGSITFYRSDDTQIAVYPVRSADTKVNSQGGFAKTFYSPGGSAYAIVQFMAISNAQTAGESSVIDETYSVIDSFIFVGSLIENGMSYMAPAWESAIETIKTEQEDKFIIGIQTDTHYYNGCSVAIGTNLKQLTKEIAFDCIANLGDIIQGYNNSVIDDPVNSRASMTEIVKRYCNGAECPVLLLLGNHDSNYMHAAAFGSDEFTFGELFGRIIKPSINTNQKAIIQNGRLYYYADFPALRLIVVNTNDGSTPHNYEVSNEQVEWFTDEALNTNKPVLILSHVPLVPGVSDNYDASYADIVNALVAFKNNGGDVVGCFNGHTHEQSSTTSDGILFVSFDDSIGFAGENTAEIVMIDVTNKTITTYGFGTASNRSFTY